MNEYSKCDDDIIIVKLKSAKKHGYLVTECSKFPGLVLEDAPDGLFKQIPKRVRELLNDKKAIITFVGSSMDDHGVTNQTWKIMQLHKKNERG